MSSLFTSLLWTAVDLIPLIYCSYMLSTLHLPTGVYSFLLCIFFSHLILILSVGVYVFDAVIASVFLLTLNFFTFLVEFLSFISCVIFIG